MSGELSSDATLLAKGCECESFGSPGTGPGVGGPYVHTAMMKCKSSGKVTSRGWKEIPNINEGARFSLIKDQFLCYFCVL